MEEIETEEERVLQGGGKLLGSMVGRRRVATTWAVGEAWERFSKEKREVVRKSFRVLGISLPMDGSDDGEISVKGLDTSQLIAGLADWRSESIPEEEIVVDENPPLGENSESAEEIDFYYD
ncbi:hypothetical protein HOY82DRAFT_536693 [Tuber indicum]|nr:hypothetical protein HOY82DRAFT_536693 [Tuber indicum]